MEERVRFRLGEQSQRRITAYDVVEVRVIDMEGLLREGLMSNAGPQELLWQVLLVIIPSLIDFK